MIYKPETTGYFVGQIRIPGRPRTMNQVRKAGWQENARHTKDEREAAYFHWRQRLGVPRLLPKGLTVTIQVRTKSNVRQDCGAAMPLVKAVIDGLIDGKWIEDDGPDWIAQIVFRAPSTGHDSDDTLISLHAPLTGPSPQSLV